MRLLIFARARQRAMPAALIVSFTFALLCASPTAAAEIKDQAFEPSPPDTIPTIYFKLRWAQTFTVGVSGTLTGVEVLVAQMFGVQPDDLQVTIFDTVNGIPRAPITPPVNIPAASVPIVAHPSNFSEYAYLRASFELDVTAGQVLAILVTTPNSPSTYYWAGALYGGYPRGALYRFMNTSWVVQGSEDQAFRTFVAPSHPPTANAGSNQTVRPGTTVTLDGSGSYDDNTDTALLQYAWRFVSIPAGSAATLCDATKMTPSFVPDVAGDYVVQLVVTDQDGLSSRPSQVTIGGNPPPVANAGPDQLVIVNQVVTLNGSAIDPDSDSISYSWLFAGAPSGSLSQFAQPNAPVTTFVPDLPGVYVTMLTPSDFVGAGAPSSATITVTTATTYVEIAAQFVATEVQAFPSDAVTTTGNQNALVHVLSNVVVALQSGDVDAAREHLSQAISRTDGCARQGAPDGSGIGRDWIVACDAQQLIYPALVAALDALTGR